MEARPPRSPVLLILAAICSTSHILFRSVLNLNHPSIYVYRSLLKRMFIKRGLQTPQHDQSMYKKLHPHNALYVIMHPCPNVNIGSSTPALCLNYSVEKGRGLSLHAD